MIKTAEHFIQGASARSGIQEKLVRSWKRFSGTVFFYIVLVLVAAWIGSRGEYNLAGDSSVGFALWFLLLPGYLSVSLLGGICWACGIELIWSGNEAWLLGICDIVQALLLYILISLWAFRRKRPGYMDVAVHFARILIWWGIFQMLCCAVRAIWTNGSISVLH